MDQVALFNCFVRWYNRIHGDEDPYTLLNRSSNLTDIRKEEDIFYQLVKEYGYKEKTTPKFNDIYDYLPEEKVYLKLHYDGKTYYSNSLLSLLTLVADDPESTDWTISKK